MFGDFLFCCSIKGYRAIHLRPRAPKDEMKRDPENKAVLSTCFECILNVSTNLLGQHIVQVFLSESSRKGCSQSYSWSRKRAYDLLKIENRSHKLSHKLDRIGVGRIRAWKNQARIQTRIRTLPLMLPTATI